MTETELDELALGSIKRLIAGKSGSEILSLWDELAQGLRSALDGLAIQPVGDAQRRLGEDGIIAARNHIMQRRLEVSYLSTIVGDP
jgi:hypothetical protein